MKKGFKESISTNVSEDLTKMCDPVFVFAQSQSVQCQWFLTTTQKNDHIAVETIIYLCEIFVFIRQCNVNGQDISILFH